MSTDSDRREINQKFKESKEYRDAFIAEHIYSRLPLKIRRLREQRGWSQKELGEKMGMAQAWVSKLEDPSYGKYTIATLLRLASAFDVGLDIHFSTFSEVLDKALTLTPDSFKVASFADDLGFVESRISTIQGVPIGPITSPSHRGRPDHEGRRDALRSVSSASQITAVTDTQGVSGRVSAQQKETAEMLEEFNVYAETTR